MDQSNETNKYTTQVGENEIVITRIFNAPRGVVFDAWMKEEHLSKWWGPNGFTSTFQKFDMKPGGVWEFIMHGPDGVDFPNTNIIVEILPLEKIVLKHDVFPHFVATAIFENEGVKTKLTYSSFFEEEPSIFDKVKTYAVPGAEQTMDRLEMHLASMF
ncbi:polyketide cyclase [Bacillus sp. AFS002410]|uniref:SRPBCC family protein n=1 Tax=Bacillus sp. AFS002410 TaxID=2033481 RepID=UPI000BF1A2B5|nr:SRPBCC family protein [Bacillus sp. AFS002410]PEJ57118.1 polyketide cyclase [Bacillus sp. AFS002410]